MKNVIGSPIPLEAELREEETAVVKFLHTSIQHSTIESVNRKSTVLPLSKPDHTSPSGAGNLTERRHSECRVDVIEERRLRRGNGYWPDPALQSF